MGFLEGIIGRLFDSIVGGIIKGVNDARKDAKLEELGAANAENAKLELRMKVINMAREIDRKPVPNDIAGVLARL